MISPNVTLCNNAADTASFIFAFLFPILIMTNVPTTASSLDHGYPENIKRIFTYFVVPLLVIYIAILTVYIVKIFPLWKIPNNVIVCLTGVCGCTSLLSYLAVYPLNGTTGVIGWFSKHVFKLMLLPLIAYAISLGLRIQDHGLTESRYVAMLYWIWLALVAIASFFKKPPHHLRWLLGTAAAISFLAVLGPLRMTAVAAHSQCHRLASLLTTHGLLSEGKIHKSARPIPLKEEQEIISIVSYLVKTNKINYIKPWFSQLETLSLQGEKKVITKN